MRLTPSAAFAALSGNYGAFVLCLTGERCRSQARAHKGEGGDALLPPPPSLPPSASPGPVRHRPALPAPRHRSIPDSPVVKEAHTWSPAGFPPVTPTRCEEEASVLSRSGRARGRMASEVPAKVRASKRASRWELSPGVLHEKPVNNS